MNKIKVLYDVFKTMKDKEAFNGEFKVEAIIKDKKVFDLSNEFSTNNKTGNVKTKVSTEVDYENKKFKHEGTTEFTMKDHKHHHHGRPGMWVQGGNLKDKLSHATFVLGILNKIKVEEDGDKTLLSLDLKEIINEVKEIRPDFQDKVCKHHDPLVKEFMEMDATEGDLKVWINKSNELEKIEILANGNKNITAEEVAKESFKLLLDLTW